MPTGGEHFALDWIKGDLLETLNEIRIALDDYAELGGEETRLRACLTGLHQVHGTLVMLELEGVTRLADHLEQLAQAMHDSKVDDTGAAGQILMQGVLELPGYLDELQHGGSDSAVPRIPLINEIRALLGMVPLADTSTIGLDSGADESVIARFESINGAEKVARIRSAYQSALLQLLKGEDRTSAITILGKAALGLAKVCEGAPLERQWWAFGEFVASLDGVQGALEAEAVKLLRRIDVEIKSLAKNGPEALRRPANVELEQRLLDAAVARDHSSSAVEELQASLSATAEPVTLAISGRQALFTATKVLQEELGIVNDKLDLLVRAPSVDLEQLRQIISPLKQIGSTLTVLGIESSRLIIADQTAALEQLISLGDQNPQSAMAIANALYQVDENLSSLIQGTGQTEVEKITTEAQLRVLSESRKGLEEVKQSVVDFVTAHWSVGHLQEVPGKLTEICGVLGIIPLENAIGILSGVKDYTEDRLLNGHRPDWQELDRFADVVSAVDYYLERLGEGSSSGAEEIITLAQRSLTALLELAAHAQIAEASEAAPLGQQADTDFDLGSSLFDDVEEAIEPPSGEESESAQEQPDPFEYQSLAPTLEDQAVAPEAAATTETADAPLEELPDPEIVEIFVEEVGEVLETLAEFVPQWEDGLETNDALTEVRRAFHTLKGSGRIVHAVEIGELAWCVENMLNRVMDGTVTPTPQFVTVINEARTLIPSLRDAFAAGRHGDIEAVGVIVDMADLLASGAALPEAEEEQTAVEVAELAPALEGGIDLADVVEETTQEEPALALDDELPGLDDLAVIIADEQPVPEMEAAGPEGVTEQLDEKEESDFAVFVEEVSRHLEVIREENNAQPWLLSETLARAFHTLLGAAALAQAEGLKLVVEPADQAAEFFRSQAPTEDLHQFFREAEQHLQDFVQSYSEGGIWEEPLEFVARADDLFAGVDTTGRPVDMLLDAPVTAALFEKEKEMAALVAGSIDSADGIVAVLSDLVAFHDSAPEMNMAPMADLAGALVRQLREVPVVQIADSQNEAAAGILLQAYEQIIDQLNELAGGAPLESQAGLVDELAALSFVTASVQDEARVEVEEPVEEATVQDAPEAVLDPEDIAELAEIDEDLIHVFFEESEEISEELERNIVSWAGERENRLYMENLLRSLHTLKGGARLCGLARLGDQAHDFESMVIEVQENNRPIDDDLFGHLHARYDALTEQLALMQAQVTGTPADLQAAAEEISADPEQPAEFATVEAAAEERPSETPVAAVTPLREVAAEPSQSEEAPAPAAPIVERQPQEMVRVSSTLLEQLVNLAGESSILRARIEQGMSDFGGALDEMETTIERLREQLRRLEIEMETQILYRHERNDGSQYENFDPLEMDRYSQLQQLSRGLSESASDMLDLKETLLFKSRESETLLLQQARINTELQEGLMRTRMVPFSRLLPRLRRIVRQVASELDKDVELHLQNAEGVLDRNLLERMVPPLEHMLRNAVDHGIEAAEMRRKHGKPATGRIDLRLIREGGDVVIDISDDGAGIDAESIRRKAVERGLMLDDAPLSDEEVLQFVLAAGFSTAKSVTQISGRGVGLDVVNSEVKQLGGSVNISSSPGKGSRFIVRVPFTVSVNRALMVSVGEDQYAIPLNTIEGVVLLSPEQLQGLYGGENKSFEYAGVPYRVRYLGQYLGREYQVSDAGQDGVPLVLVRSGDHAVAILVDQVLGSREIVVKGLGPQFAGVGGISGATILGDGSVVVILDLLALIRAQQSKVVAPAHTVKSVSRGPRCVMVVDDSVTVRKVTSRLLERQGMDVLVAKDGIEAVAMLQEQRPDIMLLDIEMPRMDGFEVARQIRHDDRLSKLPIVMISSRTGEKHKEHASELGVNKFLGKPFQENELLATIDELVSGA